jgi:mannan endo-1,4-beta-mannosidase
VGLPGDVSLAFALRPLGGGPSVSEEGAVRRVDRRGLTRWGEGWETTSAELVILAPGVMPSAGWWAARCASSSPSPTRRGRTATDARGGHRHRRRSVRGFGASLVCSRRPSRSRVVRRRSPWRAAPTTGFVRREGTRFVLAGAPFRFVGANVSVTHGPTQRAALDRVLDAVAEDGLRVVRVWALGEYPADAPPWARDYAWRLGPEGWVEETAIHLDRVLDAARARGLRVVLVLGNRWADYGGATRYLQWAGLRAPDATGALSASELGGLFRDATAEGLYRAHVARVVGRVSSTTGRPYRDDPAVFAWELINESEALPRDRDALVAWTQSLARQVRALDPNHLVAAGHIGYRRAADRATWRMVQALDEIGYADGHAYPAELGAVPGLAALDAYVDDHAQLARHVLAKPFVWGEFGFGTLSPTHRGLARAAWTARFLARSQEDGVAGALAWIYAPADPRAPRARGVRRRPAAGREPGAPCGARPRGGADAPGRRHAPQPQAAPRPR